MEAYLRVIDEPVLRLASVDLAARADITSLAEVFDFARDYLGLLKAALIASGLVPITTRQRTRPESAAPVGAAAGSGSMDFLLMLSLSAASPRA